MAEDYKEVSIQTLNRGAIVDLFDEAWERIMENIADENCDAETSREMTIKIKVKPAKDRASANTDCKIGLKLAQLKTSESFVLFSKSSGTMTAYTTDPKQQGLPFDGGNVLSINGGKG